MLDKGLTPAQPRQMMMCHGCSPKLASSTLISPPSCSSTALVMTIETLAHHLFCELADCF